MPIRVISSTAELHEYTRGRLRAGQSLALVPTMGFLHDGHTSLMREGVRRADVVAASIFVNPTQFGPKEDLSTYPKDRDGDLAKCEAAGVSVAFLPDAHAVYPPGFQTYVNVEKASQGLCGDRRPGHFRGVATVVTKLFTLFRPEVALFGEKDFQQLCVIRALAKDLDLGVDVVGMPTVREADGLAKSSRNSYLSADERQRAVAISRGLFAAQAAFVSGTTRAESLLELVRAQLRAAAIREDYVELRDEATLEPLVQIVAGQRARLFVAGFLGKTRLIDNVRVG